MKKDGKYRFSLQFSSDTPENMQIGELLERLGNKKSRVIISALTEDLQKHPQLSEESCKIEIRATGYYICYLGFLLPFATMLRSYAIWSFFILLQRE